MNRRIRCVLAAVELEIASDAGLRSAAELARECSAELHVVYGLTSTSRSGRQTHGRSDVIERARLKLRRRVDDVLGDEAPADSVEVVVGEAYRAIVERATAIDADVVVIGPHRPRAAFDTLLGTTADRVIRTAAMPCLVANAPLNGPIRRILVPTDFSDAAGRALELAVDWFGATARERGATPSILEVVHVATIVAGGVRLNALEPRLDRQVRSGSSRLPAGSGAKLHGRILTAATPVDGIASAADELEADLVVLGTHGAGALPRTLIGSVASAVARSVAYPLLLVPPTVD